MFTIENLGDGNCLCSRASLCLIVVHCYPDRKVLRRCSRSNPLQFTHAHAFCTLDQLRLYYCSSDETSEVAYNQIGRSKAGGLDTCFDVKCYSLLRVEKATAPAWLNAACVVHYVVNSPKPLVCRI